MALNQGRSYAARQKAVADAYRAARAEAEKRLGMDWAAIRVAQPDVYKRIQEAYREARVKALAGIVPHREAY